ncbi:hypothetical protein [Halobacteriovorax sp. DA5]|uniref:hypothetical protein n=1 Tax=Halobacteriovorax sp. DA5 TaxID=2067553 RepID=UPI000CD2D573|nr:hypothetical protein [Halobacteriovorax sp. DA5]POB14693.1 hypothetical protein C0Z22_06245 [Halobacteriovorax sp. DA5]
MKKLLLAATLFISINASANQIKICAMEAQETCKELTNKEDFYTCFNSVRDYCIDNYMYQSGNKSMPWCFDECALVQDEAQRNLCYETCTEK